MEEPRAHFGDEQGNQEAELNPFLRFGRGEELTPIFDLPRSYRQQIEAGYSTGWECLDQYLHGLRGGHR